MERMPANAGGLRRCSLFQRRIFLWLCKLTPLAPPPIPTTPTSTPGDFEKQVFFTNSGTESIEAAMKLCRYFTGRPVLISFLGAFHGRTYGSMSLSSSKYLHRTRFQPLLAGIYHAPYPNTYRPP